MIQLDTYLNFEGYTEEAFNHYRKVFGNEFSTLMRFGDMPGGEKMSAQDKMKIMHVSLPIGNSVLMGTDILASMNQKLNMGDNFSISVSLDNETEANRIFDELSADGDIIMPMGKESWSDLFGICRDKYKIQWMINYKKPQ